MTLNELSDKELEILKRVEQVTGLMEDQNVELQNLGIFDEYKAIFNEYAQVHEEELEALKRCLFLYWYALCEPGCFTGISGFDIEVIKKVLRILDRKLSTSDTDYELEWMLKYYSNWDFVFEPFPDFINIHKKMKEPEKTELPETIDRESMSKRGQMGYYWNHLTRFENIKPAS
jgi:hypothetical protein